MLILLKWDLCGIKPVFRQAKLPSYPSNIIMQTPNTTYKNTEIGSIPVDWEVKTLGEIATLITKGTTPKKFSKTGINYIKIECLEGNKINIEKCLFVDEITNNTELKRSILQEDDLLFAIAGATIGKCTIVTKEIIPANTNQALAIIRLPKGENKKYIFYFLKSVLMQKYVIDNIAGGAQPNLNLAQIGRFSFPIPPTLTEQTAIANALSDADALINKVEKLITKKRNIKQGAMQKLLQPKEGWEVKKLGEVIKKKQLGGNYHNSEVITDFPLIKMGNIQRGQISINKVEYVIENIKPDKKDKLFYGDLLFNTRNTLELVGKISIWRNELNEAYFNSNLMRLEFDENFISSNFFMNYLLNTRIFVAKLKDIAIGTTSVAAIYTRDLVKIEISLPPLKTQIEIAQILSDMDLEIAGLEGKLSKYRAIKTGMMQNLLTGKIRLV